MMKTLDFDVSAYADETAKFTEFMPELVWDEDTITISTIWSKEPEMGDIVWTVKYPRCRRKET